MARAVGAAFANAALGLGRPTLGDVFAGEVDDGIGVAEGFFGRLGFGCVPDGEADVGREVCAGVAGQDVQSVAVLGEGFQEPAADEAGALR